MGSVREKASVVVGRLDGVIGSRLKSLDKSHTKDSVAMRRLGAPF